MQSKIVHLYAPYLFRPSIYYKTFLFDFFRVLWYRNNSKVNNKGFLRIHALSFSSMKICLDEEIVYIHTSLFRFL